MFRAFLSVTLTLALGLIVAAQQKSTSKSPPPHAQPSEPEFKISAGESAQKNPVPTSPASISAGKSLWSSQCAMCHGADGSGKGDLAVEMKLNLRDYRDPKSLEKFTDGDLFTILSKGKGQMIGEGTRLRPDQRWNLINFIRSLARKEAPAPAKSGS